MKYPLAIAILLLAFLLPPLMLFGILGPKTFSLGEIGVTRAEAEVPDDGIFGSSSSRANSLSAKEELSSGPEAIKIFSPLRFKGDKHVSGTGTPHYSSH